MKLNKFFIGLICLVPMMTCVACNDKQETHQPNFETDSWENVIAHANSLQTLLDYYKPANNTFVGLKKEIVMTMPDYVIKDDETTERELTGEKHQIKHTVMVIGENEDFSDEDNTKPIALTFKFYNTLSQKNIYYNEFTYYSNHSNAIFLDYSQVDGKTWKDNPVNQFLNSNEDNGFRKMLPIEVSQAIKPVYKKSLHFDTTQEKITGIDNEQCYCFLNSITEFYKTTGIIGFVDEESVQEYAKEGKQYSYYKKWIGDNNYFNHIANIVTPDTTNHLVESMYRSITYDHEGKPYFVNSSRPMDSKGRYTMAPCFCI